MKKCSAEYLPGWEAWDISAQIERMPDGFIALTGLVIAPIDDYDGSRYDQILTTAKLRTLPISRLAEMTAGADAARRGELALATEHLRAARENARGDGVGRKRETLEYVVSLYREAVADPATRTSPRKYVVESSGLSAGYINRLLRQARQHGLLEPYRGKQGKHGKSV